MRIDVQNLADFFDGQKLIVLRSLDRLGELLGHELTKSVQQSIERTFYRLAHKQIATSLTLLPLSPLLCVWLFPAPLPQPACAVPSRPDRYDARSLALFCRAA